MVRGMDKYSISDIDEIREYNKKRFTGFFPGNLLSDELLEYLSSNFYFTAPSACSIHGAWIGGNFDHSMRVTEYLLQYTKDGGLTWEREESPYIIGMFHDLCKIGSYKTEMRWRKDSNNRWEQYPTYTFKEDFAYGGHGAKSVYLVQSFMHLTPDEASAINCHMGQWDSTQYSNPTEVYCRNRLAWLLHVADEAADFLLDNEEVR